MYRLPWQCLIICPFSFMLLHFVICSSSSSLSKPASCSPQESQALLHFKNSFSIKYNESFEDECINNISKTRSWKEDSDRCLWNGVGCDPLTGHVTRLDLSCSWLFGTLYPNNTLFNLQHLRKLNLARNDFNGSEISSRFVYFTKLTHLDLSYSNFTGLVPHEISYLFNLRSLQLSDHIKIDQHGFDRLAQNLTNLRYLYLESVDLSYVSPSSLLNISTSLVSLLLNHNRLQGRFPR